MLRTGTKIQLALFVIITLLGISYVSAEYVGLTKFIANNGCTVSADFPDSGGIFTNAEVTYRGVTVGQVGDLHLLGSAEDLPKGGVRVDLKLDDCSSPKIPSSVSANIANRSVVGEQYVNLVPPANAGSGGPYISASALIPASRNTVPVPTQNLLLHLDQLVSSVPLDALRTTITELGYAVAGRGADLGSLLDSTNALLKTASTPDNLTATLKLIEDSSSVLQTQLDEQQPLQSWTRSLNLLSQQLKQSDPDIRRLLDDGPGALTTVSKFITDNQTDIGVTLANLSVVGNLIVRHINGVEEVLELYPALAAGGQSVLNHDSVFGGKEGALGLVLQAADDPPDCGTPNADFQGYSGTVRRTPDQNAPIAPNVAVRCTASPTTPTTGPDPTNVRGSANVPGGDPISLSGGGYAYARASTSNTVQIGPAITADSTVNDGRYSTMLTASLG